MNDIILKDFTFSDHELDASEKKETQVNNIRSTVYKQKYMHTRQKLLENGQMK